MEHPNDDAMDWAERVWAHAAKEERDRCDARSVDELVAEIRAGNYGRVYQIWSSLTARASLQQVGWLFFDLLNSDADYLIRYHCANALFSIGHLHEHGFRDGGELSVSTRYPVDKNLARLREVLELKLGPRPR